MSEHEAPEEETLDATGDGQAPVQPVSAAEPDPFGALDEVASSAEAALFPATADAQPPDVEGAVDDEAAEPETFASAEAPWVGAEKKWLRGVEGGPSAPTPTPAEEELADAAAKPLSLLGDDDDDDALLVAAQIPVLPSLIPPARAGVGLGLKLGIAGALILVVGVAAAIVYWMNESFVEREREILALRDSDKQEVVRLEREIRELLARGGAKNEERANELKIALLAAQKEAADSTPGDGAAAHGGDQERLETRDSEGAEGTLPTLGAGEPATPHDEPAAADTAGSAPAPEDPEAADLLDSAFTKPPAAAAAAPPPIQGAAEFPLGGTELPASPSRDQVKAAMDSIAPQVKACGSGGGRIVLSLAVAGATGRVVSAEPTGDHAGTPLGLCAARAVKPAKFPHFKQERLLIKYPFEM